MKDQTNRMALLRVLHGPHLFGSCTGAMVKVTWTAEQSLWLKQSPTPQSLKLWESIVSTALGLRLSISPRFPDQRQPCWLDYLLALNDALRWPYCIEQQPTSVRGWSDTSAVLFVPCDVPPLGLGASNLATSLMLDLFRPAALAIESGDVHPSLALLLQSWSELLKTWPQAAHAHALHNPVRWLAREALRRDIPYLRTPGSNDFLRIGQGIHQRRVFGKSTDNINCAASLTAQDQQLTSMLLGSHGLPTQEPPLAGAHRHKLLVVGGRWLAAVREQAQQPLARPPTVGADTPQDVTPLVHADNRALAELAARVLMLSTASMDLHTPDISRSWKDVGASLHAIHAGTDQWTHAPKTAHYNIPEAILKDLFPPGKNGRVITAGITGSLGKTTTCRMLAHILEYAGHTVALTGTQGAFLQGQTVRKGDVAGGLSALNLLHDPSVTASVAELARGGLIKHGLGFDSLDVGAVLNVLDNHLGLDGVNTREEMARVKQLVVQHARKLMVLNADDPLCQRMSEGVTTARLCWVGESPSDLLSKHQEAGGMVATLRQSEHGPLLCLLSGHTPLGEMPMAHIPATWNARFRPAMINALFATALAHGLGVPFTITRAALSTFKSDYGSNPGRMNHVSGLPFELWLSWADGPQALAEMADFIRNDPRDVKKSVVFYVVGNRSDEFIQQSAASVAGAFDRYYCCDMEEDRRGRAVGEVALMLSQKLLQCGIEQNDIVVEPSSNAAVVQALHETRPGDILFIESYLGDRVMQIVRSMWPQAV